MADDGAGRPRRRPPTPGRTAGNDTFDAFTRHTAEAPSEAGGPVVPGNVTVRDQDGVHPDTETASTNSSRRCTLLIGLSVFGVAVLGVGLFARWLLVEPTSASVRERSAAQGVPATTDIAGATTSTSAPSGLAALVPMNGSTASASAATSSPPPPSKTASTAASVQVNTYVAELNSGNPATIQAAITGLAQLMSTTPADQPAAINALCTYLRTVSPAGSNDTTMPVLAQKAVAALVGRNASHDGGAVLKLDNTNLTGANLVNADLAGVSAQNTDFDMDNLTGANLSGANLQYAYFGETTITNTDFASANLAGVSFAKTPLCNGKTPTEPALGYNCVL
jgi:hypothetical protein